jgi:hypothetical protein
VQASAQPGPGSYAGRRVSEQPHWAVSDGESCHHWTIVFSKGRPSEKGSQVCSRSQGRTIVLASITTCKAGRGPAAL